MAARIPSFNMFVIDWMGIIFGGTDEKDIQLYKNVQFDLYMFET